MGERLKPAVLKTAVRETVPGVRIPLPPPELKQGPALRTGFRQPAPGLTRRGLAPAKRLKFESLSLRQIPACGTENEE